jgi:Raf kinase inhibitor-like YbhB/YbcL family protein
MGMRRIYVLIHNVNSENKTEQYIIFQGDAMVRKITVVTLLFVIILGVFYFSWNRYGAKTAKTMEITSTAFQNNAKIPSKYSCDGSGVNPPLSFSGVPADAKSLVLIVDDPDAPSGTFAHWILFNIDPQVRQIAENSVPKSAIEGKNSIGKTNFVGACPPPASPEQLQRGKSGTHRYFFKLYALDTVLNSTNADKAALEKAMRGHILQKAELIGLYSRI